MNKTNRDIFINIITSIFGILVSTVVLLYIYRLANNKLGIEQIGLWSIVTTLTSLGHIGTFGIAGSLVKFSAELQSKGERDTIIGLLNSCVLIMSGLIVLFLAVLYIFSLLFLSSFVDIKFIESAFALLPYSFLIFFLSTIGYLVLSVVEGLNKSWQKNVVVIISNVLLLCFASFWIDKYGIYGIFYSQLIQAAVIFCLSFVLIRLNFSNYKFNNLNRNMALLKRITNYGLKFQSVSILQMMGEPVTKFFLSRYGGLGLVGLFEMASRIVVQLRGIVLAIISNLLPKLVDIHSNHPTEKIHTIFKNIFKINFYLFAFVFGLLILFSPVIVQVWLGDMDPKLIYLIQILSVSWFINSITVVPYIFNLGSGNLNGNVYSHALMALCNMFFGLVVIVSNYQAIGFIYVWLLSLTIGSGYLLIEYMNRNKMTFAEIFSWDHISILLIILLNYILLWVLLNKAWMSSILIYTLVGLIYLFLMLVNMLRSQSFTIIRGYFTSFNFLFTNNNS